MKLVKLKIWPSYEFLKKLGGTNRAKKILKLVSQDITDESHVYHFLLLIDDTLLVSNINSHNRLLWLYDNRSNITPSSLSDLIASIPDEYRKLNKSRLVAAGAINEEGQVVEWKSNFFQISTPEKLKESIEKNAKKVVKNWQTKIPSS